MIRGARGYYGDAMSIKHQYLEGLRACSTKGIWVINIWEKVQLEYVCVTLGGG